SPSASRKCWGLSARACRTPRSPRCCSSPGRRPSITWPVSWPSPACGAALKPPGSPAASAAENSAAEIGEGTDAPAAFHWHRLLMSELHERPPRMRLFDPRPFVLEMRRAVMAAQFDTGLGRFIHANGIDIHFTDAGAGEPLILLENGMISTNPIWAGWLS